MAATEWIADDESAKEMLSRVLTDRPFLVIPPLHRIPLRVGNVVEIAGTSPSAKTEILIQAANTCILPKEWNGVRYGGLDRLVLYIDLDCSFDILRLSKSLKHRIMEAKNYDIKEGTDVALNEELHAMCMRRFIYTRCYDSFEFLATLKTLRNQCEKERDAHKVAVYMLMIDSIGAFHWVDRASTSLATGSDNRKRFSLQSVFESVVGELQKLVLVHPMLVLATKATIIRDSYSLNNTSRLVPKFYTIECSRFWFPNISISRIHAFCMAVFCYPQTAGASVRFDSSAVSCIQERIIVDFTEYKAVFQRMILVMTGLLVVQFIPQNGWCPH